VRPTESGVKKKGRLAAFFRCIIMYCFIIWKLSFFSDATDTVCGRNYVEVVQVLISLPLSKMSIKYKDRIGVMQVTICSTVASRKGPSSRVTLCLDFWEWESVSLAASNNGLWNGLKKESEMMCHFEKRHIWPHLARTKP
jgi:hypothetical protein